MKLMNTNDVIADAIARTLWLCAYADAIENDEIKGKRPGAGEDWNNFAPRTPKRAIYEAWKLIGMTEQLNDCCLAVIIYNAGVADGHYTLETLAGLPYKQLTKLPAQFLESFGHYLAMESLGHGVSWTDDHKEFTVPHNSKGTTEFLLPLVELHYEDLRG